MPSSDAGNFTAVGMASGSNQAEVPSAWPFSGVAKRISLRAFSLGEHLRTNDQLHFALGIEKAEAPADILLWPYDWLGFGRWAPLQRCPRRGHTQRLQDLVLPEHAVKLHSRMLHVNCYLWVSGMVS